MERIHLPDRSCISKLLDLLPEVDSSSLLEPIDELDAIGSKRLDSATSGDGEAQRTLMQLLSELDGFAPLEDVKEIAHAAYE